MHLNDLLGGERSADVLQMLGSAFAKGTAILLLGAVCALFARGASAATKHLVWTLTLAGALAAPAIGMFVPHWTVSMGPFASALRERLDVAGVPEPVTVPPDLAQGVYFVSVVAGPGRRVVERRALPRAAGTVVAKAVGRRSFGCERRRRRGPSGVAVRHNRSARR